MRLCNQILLFIRGAFFYNLFCVAGTDYMINREEQMKKNGKRTGKMKRAGAAVLLAVLLCGLTACGGTEREWKTEFSSADWKTLELSLDGRILTFPILCTDLEAVGYKIDTDKASRMEVLEAGYYTTGVPMENKEGVKIYVRFKNFGEKDKSLKDCEVYGLSLHYDDYEGANPEVLLCCGITFDSTVDEVREAMGEPYDYHKSESDFTEGVYTEILKYYVTESVHSSNIEFSFYNGEMYQIAIVNTD